MPRPIVKKANRVAAVILFGAGGVVLGYLAFSGRISQGISVLLAFGYLYIFSLLRRRGFIQVQTNNEGDAFGRTLNVAAIIKLIICLVGALVWAGLGAFLVKIGSISDTPLADALIIIPAGALALMTGYFFFRTVSSPPR